MFLGCAIVLAVSMAGCNSEETTTEKGRTQSVENEEVVIDFEDAATFEKALNDGEKVKGKIVKFDVVEYKPDSALGINCWSGEHLNFISEIELNVSKGDIVVGRITDEPSKNLGSWKILYEVIGINPDGVAETTTGEQTEGTTEEQAEITTEEQTETTAEETTVTPTEEVVGNLTIENCEELAAILANKAEIDDSYGNFASKYSRKTIEFDGRIDYLCNNGSYKTRYDVLVSAGDYDPNHQIGPAFKFENVSILDMGADDDIHVGDNVHIVAEVVKYDSSTGLFFLEPISLTHR